MAKWGEGDPRWIVEERPDGTNVNNWHWVEKNATVWSKDKLRKLLEGMCIEDENMLVQITEITKMEGEAMANCRKGKLIFFYEWVIAAEWKGNLKASENKVKGTIDIPNLSEEHDAKDVDVEVSTKNSSDEGYIVKEFMRVHGTVKIKDQLAVYIRDLRDEYGQGAILPTKATNKTQVMPATHTTSSVKEEFNKMSVNNGVTSPSTSKSPTKLQTRTLCRTEDFKCSPPDLYRALTMPEMIQAYAGHDSTIDIREGGHFSLFGGNVTGYFTQLVPDEKITSKWRFKTWPAEHFSDVTITITKNDDDTKLVLRQTNIPESEYDQTTLGWDQNYWGRIRTVFGFGGRIF